MIKDNLKEIYREIELAERLSPYGQHITLVAVSKTKPVSDIVEAYDAGIRDFGENKVQELCDKYPKLPKDIRWHLIGHLQRNKVPKVLDKVFLIHSVDSLRLADEIEKNAGKKDIIVNVLIQVNISGEDSKSGFSPEEVIPAIKTISNMKHICIKGLMTIAPIADEAVCRDVFRKLKNLSIDIEALNIDNVFMDFMSMGMSNDFSVAISEGATHVRIGTRVFGKRNYDV